MIELTYICPILGLKVVNHLVKSFEDPVALVHFTLLNEKTAINDLIDQEKFSYWFGKIAMAEMFVNRDVYMVSKAIFDDEREGGIYLSDLSGYFFRISIALWLIKDNACYVTDAYGLNTENNIYKIFSRTLMTSSASSDYTRTEYTVEEVNLALDYLEKLNIFLQPPLVSEEKAQTENGALKASIHQVNFSKTSRIFRAILFITSARSVSVLPQKISFYIASLECLFTSDGTEVSHKVCERVAFYIDTASVTERIDIYNKMQIAYSIRSRFLHGQALSKDHVKQNYLREASIAIDDYIRRILIKILDNNGDIFISDEKVFKQYFQNLIFS